MERGRVQGLPKFFGYPLLYQERVKLRTSNVVGTFIESIGTKAHENVGNSGRGRSQAVPKIFRAPICRAHCAVIFAIAQLSCFPEVSIRDVKFSFICIPILVYSVYSKCPPSACTNALNHTRHYEWIGS